MYYLLLIFHNLLNAQKSERNKYYDDAFVC